MHFSRPLVHFVGKVDVYVVYPNIQKIKQLMLQHYYRIIYKKTKQIKLYFQIVKIQLVVSK